MTFGDIVFGPVCVVAATFDDCGGHALCIWLYRSRQAPVRYGTLATAAKHVAAVTVTGHGVLTKPSQAPLALRAQASSATFLWSEHGDEVSFVRRERLQRLFTELTAAGIYPQIVFAGLDPYAAACRSREQLHLRRLLAATAAGSAAAQAVARRAAPIIAVACMLLLLAHVIALPRLHARRQELQSKLSASERTAFAAESAEMRQRELRAAFAAEPITAYASLCDRIAVAVPERAVLTLLGVELLTQRFEAGKPLVRADRAVVIYGTAPAAADISEFAVQLGELSVLRDVRLVHVERERDGELLVFRIECNL